jgi:CheY-like chemotaxis protein
MARILLVDDEPALVRSLRRRLEHHDHEVVTAENGIGALTHLTEGGFDLIVLDMNMPGMDGVEVLRSLRGARHRVPVLAMTGGGMVTGELLLTTARALGAVGTLDKPFEGEEFLAEVDHALAVGRVAEAAG